jgi:hypothetical protein
MFSCSISSSTDNEVGHKYDADSSYNLALEMKAGSSDARGSMSDYGGKGRGAGHHLVLRIGVVSCVASST